MLFIIIIAVLLMFSTILILAYIVNRLIIISDDNPGVSLNPSVIVCISMREVWLSFILYC